MPEVHIRLRSCDDHTLVSIDLTADELVTVQRLAEATKATSESDCQPVLEVVA